MLSEAQRKVLEHMTEGQIVGWMTGLYAGAYWPSDHSRRNPSPATMHRLEDLGFIKKVNESRLGWYWHPTDAGRAALKGE